MRIFGEYPSRNDRQKGRSKSYSAYSSFWRSDQYHQPDYSGLEKEKP